MTAPTSGDSLPPAVRRMLDATNSEDSEAFLASFSADAVVDDFGRTFSGHDEIARWNAQEHIGTHNRIRVEAARATDDGVVLDIQVSGQGYNGGGTFDIRLRDDTIRSLVIRG